MIMVDMLSGMTFVNNVASDVLSASSGVTATSCVIEKSHLHEVKAEQERWPLDGGWLVCYPWVTQASFE